MAVLTFAQDINASPCVKSSGSASFRRDAQQDNIVNSHGPLPVRPGNHLPRNKRPFVCPGQHQPKHFHKFCHYIRDIDADATEHPSSAIDPDTQVDSTKDLSTREVQSSGNCPTIQGFCKLHKCWPSECVHVCKNICKKRRDVAPTLELPMDYRSTALYHTNLHRMNHSAPVVTYSNDLANLARSYIAQCPAELAEAMGGVGSNFEAFFGFGLDPFNATSATVQAISNWYELEQTSYADASNNYTTEPSFSDFDSWIHFSQMVWSNKTRIGCWSVRCSTDTAFTKRFESPDWIWAVLCLDSPGK